MRSASCGFPSVERSSLRRVWASEVSETTACSITFWMLPRRRVASPPGGGVGGAEGDAGWGRSTYRSAYDPYAHMELAHRLRCWRRRPPLNVVIVFFARRASDHAAGVRVNAF